LSRNKLNFRCCRLQNFVAWSRKSFYFAQQSFATCNTKMCCATSCANDGNTRNIALQPATQQCCATGCTILLPVYYCTLSAVLGKIFRVFIVSQLIINYDAPSTASDFYLRSPTSTLICIQSTQFPFWLYWTPAPSFTGFYYYRHHNFYIYLGMKQSRIGRSCLEVYSFVCVN